MWKVEKEMDGCTGERINGKMEAARSIQCFVATLSSRGRQRLIPQLCAAALSTFEVVGQSPLNSTVQHQ